MNRCIERARDGDLPSVGALVEILRPRIFKMSAYYARLCDEDPDDLVQEGWLGLLEALPLLDMHIGSPEQYLIKHARWKILDAVKRSCIRKCISLDDSFMEIPTDRDDILDNALVSEFTTQLNNTQRAIVNCLIEGFTWREAGVQLGCTSANIAYHMRQIRRRYHQWHVAGDQDGI